MFKLINLATKNKYNLILIIINKFIKYYILLYTKRNLI